MNYYARVGNQNFNRYYDKRIFKFEFKQKMKENFATAKKYLLYTMSMKFICIKKLETLCDRRLLHFSNFLIVVTHSSFRLGCNWYTHTTSLSLSNPYIHSLALRQLSSILSQPFTRETKWRR